MTDQENNGENSGRNENGTFVKGHSLGFQPGQVTNPNGRPKKGNTWADVIREVTSMTPKDLLASIGTGEIADSLKRLPPKVKLKKLMASRAVAAFMHEPSAGIWSQIMEREDGKVPQAVTVDGDIDAQAFIVLPCKVRPTIGQQGDHDDPFNDTSDTPDS